MDNLDDVIGEFDMDEFDKHWSSEPQESTAKEGAMVIVIITVIILASIGFVMLGVGQ